MIRFGLCCMFKQAPIKFRTTTATALMKLSRSQALGKLAELCLFNARSLQSALEYCVEHRIGAFRVLSGILPVKTHPEVKYNVTDLPEGNGILDQFKRCGDYARQHGIRLSFHPDQFVLLSSPNPDVISRSIADLEYQAEVADWLGADTINIHAGGAYGDKSRALARLTENLPRLSKLAREKLTLENDDKVYTPADLLPVCGRENIPLVYDVHHHRCLPDGVPVEETTERVLSTWQREPLFHVSSPLAGWRGPKPFRHHDYIDPEDFPACWKTLPLTVDVEAKAKELAVLQLQKDLSFR